MVLLPHRNLTGGLEAERYGDPWTYAVVVSFPWTQIASWMFRLPAKATVWALSTDGNLKMSHVRPFFRWVRGHGFEPEWERILSPSKENKPTSNPTNHKEIQA